MAEYYLHAHKCIVKSDVVMLTLTSQYSLKALIHLVKNRDGAPITGSRIACQTGIPAKYLSTILRELVRADILDSAPGRRGGFRLARTPRKISLHEAVVAFEPPVPKQQRCPFGNDECSDAKPCLVHEQWKKIIEAERRFLRRVTLHDVVTERKKTSRKTRKAKS